MKKSIYLCPLISLLMACHGSVTVGDKKYSTDSGVTTVEVRKNNIQLKENGLKVSQAYLTKYDDAESRISEDNVIGKNDNISLRLVLSGWKETDGKVKPGASEKITADDGTVVLDIADLFSDLKDADAKDAQYVTIDAKFQNVKSMHSGYTIDFKVWDKDSNADVTGSFKLKVKDSN